ncbi:MAG: ROK family protein [Clostridia bacterium]|jgi:glucokinase|nr:ROK family protein [Clostridia bacterium]MBQ5602646.1 ROK family protein [Clostridia bacterium]
MYYLGIDLGGTNIAVGIVDENYNIVLKGSVPTLAHREISCVIDDMAALCKKLIADAGLTVDDIAHAGIASPGTVNSRDGIIEYSNNLKMKQCPIVKMLSERTGIKNIFVANDADAAAYGEAVAGAAKGVSNSVMITLGTGVGGGIIIDGKIYSGFNHAGGELGHTVIEKDGRPCSCGRRGCWEAYSSATGLVRMTREKMNERPDSKMWALCDGNVENAGGKTAFKAARAGDAAGKEVVDSYISYLACGLTNMINIFQPEIISIGGGVCNEGDYLLNPVKEIVAKEVYTKEATTKQADIRIAKLGNDAGIIGAAALCSK